MAGKKKFRGKKKFGRKRGRHHRKAGGLAIARVRGPGVVVPDKMLMKMSFLDVTHQAIGTVGSSVGGFSLSANSLFTNQPIGWAEISVLYRFYRVRACKATVRFVNMEAFPSNCLLTPQNATLGITLANGQIAMQNAFVKYGQVSPVTGMDHVTLKNYMSTVKLVGTQAVKWDDTYASIVTGGPTNQWFWTVYVYPLLSTDTYTAAKQVRIEFKMTYYVEWYERNILST